MPTFLELQKRIDRNRQESSSSSDSDISDTDSDSNEDSYENELEEKPKVKNYISSPYIGDKNFDAEMYEYGPYSCIKCAIDFCTTMQLGKKYKPMCDPCWEILKRSKRNKN